MAALHIIGQIILRGPINYTLSEKHTRAPGGSGKSVSEQKGGNCNLIAIKEKVLVKWEVFFKEIPYNKNGNESSGWAVQEVEKQQRAHGNPTQLFEIVWYTF